MILQGIFWLFAMGLGFFGLALVGYGVVSGFTGSQWPILEEWAPFLSALFTLVGTLLTAASVYLYAPVQRPPLHLSRVFISPAVIAASIAALICLARDRSLSTNIVNGFALLAIAGGLLRLVTFPSN